MLKKLIPICALALQFSMAQDFTIENDWFYEGIHHPASSATIEEHDEYGNNIQKIVIQFDRFGYITDAIYNDELTQRYTPYIGHKRNIRLTPTTNLEQTLSHIQSTWLDDNHLRLDDGDLITDIYYDETGKIIHTKLFLDHPFIPHENLQYHYLNDSQAKPIGDDNDVFITTLATDNFGSWTQQKEEKANAKTIIRTRTIEYLP